MSDRWREAVLRPTSTMTEAVNVLTQTSLRIVLVVDADDLLLGTLTDGDIRRALARGFSMDIRIEDIMEKDPITASMEDEPRAVLKLMRDNDLLQIPILNKQKRIINLEVIQDLVYRPERNNPVLLMAGGFGKRLHPLTRDVPKPLLMVGEKPILQVIVEQLVEAGFSKFFMAVHYKSESLRDHFGDGSQWGSTIHYLEEDEPLGTAGALSLLDRGQADVPILMMNGDLLTRLDFCNLLDYHKEQGGRVTMCTREYEFQIPYGVVKGDGVLVKEIAEKPVQTFSVNAGIYVVNPDLVDTIKRSERLDMPCLLQKILDTGGKINMYPIHEYWLDIGGFEEYKQAQTDVTKFKM